MRKTVLYPSLLCVAIVAVLFVPNARADGGAFVIQPKQDVVENWNANVGWSYTNVWGNFSANAPVDFFITDPSGTNLVSYNDTSSTTFNFVPQGSGTYQLHMANTHSTENVTVALNYHVGLGTVSSVRLTSGRQPRGLVPQQPRNHLQMTMTLLQTTPTQST
jgi:hypothetical protein